MKVYLDVLSKLGRQGAPGELGELSKIGEASKPRQVGEVSEETVCKESGMLLSELCMRGSSDMMESINCWKEKQMRMLKKGGQLFLYTQGFSLLHIALRSYVTRLSRICASMH